MTTWKPKPSHRKYVPKAEYTDEELVEYFLNITRHWYEEKENLLYGWRDQIRDELLRNLRDKDASVKDPHQLVYAWNKFESEWIGPNGMFTTAVSPWEIGLNKRKKGKK